MLQSLLSGFTYGHKMLLWRVLWWFLGRALKLEKVGPTFSSFNPRPSLPSVATDGRKPFECLNMVLNIKTGPLFLEFN